MNELTSKEEEFRQRRINAYVAKILPAPKSSAYAGEYELRQQRSKNGAWQSEQYTREELVKLYLTIGEVLIHES